MANDNKRPATPNNATNGVAPKAAAQKYAASSSAAKAAPKALAVAAKPGSLAAKDAKKSAPKKGLAALSTTQVFMIALAGTLLCVGGLWMLVLTREGDLAAERAAAMLRSFEPSSLEPLEESSHASLGDMPVALARAAYEAPDQPQYESENDVERALKTHSNYKAIAKLYIEKLNLTLPILSECTTQALKISVCKYQGPEPLQPGNMVITGHHYKNGAHFGRLEELGIDDVITVTDAAGNFRRYFVYETQVVQPENLEALDTGTNQNAVTLVTCAQDGEMRLIVKCRAI